MMYPRWRGARGARCAYLLAAVLGVVWLFGAGKTAGAVGATDLRLTLPPPTGPWAIGVRAGFLADPSRIDAATGQPRTLPLRVWYPTDRAGDGRAAPYLSAAVAPVIEQAVGAPAGSFAVDTHAASDVPMRRDIRGVILVSAGLGEPVALQTGQVIELASHGWVLVTFDHPHDTYVVEQPDGTLIFTDLTEPSLPAIERAFEQRVLDVGVVLRRLPTLLSRQRRDVPVGMFGFSIGGSAAAESMLRYRRLRAGVDLDGTAFGQVVQVGLDEPFGIMLGRHPLDQDPSLSQLVSHLRGPHPIEQLDVEHHGFTDFVVFNPEAALADPVLGAALESNFATGVQSLAAGTAALSAQRQFLTAFMRRFLEPCRGREHGARRVVALAERRGSPAERRFRCAA
jgi:hypothetical protein